MARQRHYCHPGLDSYPTTSVASRPRVDRAIELTLTRAPFGQTLGGHPGQLASQLQPLQRSRRVSVVQVATCPSFNNNNNNNNKQQAPSQDASANDLAGSSPGGRSSTLTPKTKSEMDRPFSGTTRAQSPVGAHATSVAQSEQGSGIDGDRGPAGKDVTVGGQKAEENSTEGSMISGQDRASGIQMGSKNAPAPQEAVDEYYEVSMTLKALSLEGADF